MPTPTPTQARRIDPTRRAPRPTPPERVRRSWWLLEFYRSALGKKYAMAVSGVFIMAWLVAHLVGNLKMYLSADAFNFYSDWLREGLGYPVLPHTWLLWLLRLLLIGSFVVHIHAAYALTVMNHRARSAGYRSRDYVAANFAARTMRWSGIIVGLFVIYHLLDLSWGPANPRFVRGDAYGNTLASLQRWPVALFYVLANVALGYHLYHGGWSLFQSLGLNTPRFNAWRRWFAIGFAVVVAGGFISFPLAVVSGVVS
ncbi:MAG TPA: succinate dehydrogenase cytochrome b subunit [Nitriliruptorales bacterium]|nr:succinate dehydrogenase cytochrome b subunit [Nitriliruptorales bacterium]